MPLIGILEEFAEPKDIRMDEAQIEIYLDKQYIDVVTNVLNAYEWEQTHSRDAGSGRFFVEFRKLDK